MSKTAVATCILGLAAAVVGMFVSKGSAGSVAFQFVPRQANCPISIESISLTGPGSAEVVFTLVHPANTAVESVAAAVILETYAGSRFIGTAAVRPDAPQGTRTRAVFTFPVLSNARLNEEYPEGVVFTFGLDSIRFSGGTQWESQQVSGRFAPEVGTKVQNNTDMMVRLLPGRLIGTRRLSSGPAAYPINSSVKDAGCTMSACGTGFCEFDGCSIP